MTLSHSKTYLLIGGLHDGQRREISYEPEEIRITWPAALLPNGSSFDAAKARATPAAMTVVAKDTYRKTSFSTPERKLIIYAHESLSPGDVLASLVENYRPKIGVAN